MNRVPMSSAASALLRALVGRSGAPRERILLTDVQSVDWRSLTFNGERHLIYLRITSAASSEIANRLCDGLAEAEFSIPGMFVADIGVVGTPSRNLDGSTAVTIEALTVAAD